MVSEVSQEISRSFLILSQSHHWFLMVFVSPSIGKKKEKLLIRAGATRFQPDVVNLPGKNQWGDHPA